MRPLIHSVKHYVQATLTTVTAAAEVSFDIITVSEAPTANDQVEEGANVKACYVELWIEGTVTNQFFTVCLWKAPTGQADMSITNMANLGNFSGKKNILFTSQGLAGNDGVGGPLPIMRGWYKIPKGKSRFGAGDRLVLQVASRGDNSLNFCGFATYKEYR